MCSKLTHYVNFFTAPLLLLSAYFYSANAYAEEEKIGLFASPNTCVALNKGRKCFAKVNVTWRTKEKGFYCVSIDANEVPIKCWRDANKGELMFEMSSDKNVTILLHTAAKDSQLSQAIIEVSWLYAGDSRKRRWRLF